MATIEAAIAIAIVVTSLGRAKVQFMIAERTRDYFCTYDDFALQHMVSIVLLALAVGGALGGFRFGSIVVRIVSAIAGCVVLILIEDEILQLVSILER